jgi:hypothetical protein
MDQSLEILYKCLRFWNKIWTYLKTIEMKKINKNLFLLFLYLPSQTERPRDRAREKKIQG